MRFLIVLIYRSGCYHEIDRAADAKSAVALAEQYAHTLRGANLDVLIRDTARHATHTPIDIGSICQ